MSGIISDEHILPLFSVAVRIESRGDTEWVKILMISGLRLSKLRDPRRSALAMDQPLPVPKSYLSTRQKTVPGTRHQVLTLTNSADNPSQTPLSHLEGRTILTKTDAVDRVDGGSLSQHCKTIHHTTKVQEEIAGSQRGVQLLQCITDYKGVFRSCVQNLCKRYCVRE